MDNQEVDVQRKPDQSQIQGQQSGGAPLSHPELEKEVRINRKLTYFVHWVTTSGVH